MPLKPWLLAVGVGISLGCQNGERGHRPIPISFAVESDPGVRLSDAEVVIDGRPIGVTGADGLLQAEVHGGRDRSLQIEHRCPPGHFQPSKPKRFRLRPVDDVRGAGPVAVQVTLQCRPEQRLAVFVIKAPNGSHLPVKLDGRLVARTNASGVAHFFVSGPPGTEHAIELDTSERPRLLPRSPTQHFTLPDAHEVFVVDQAFEMEKEVYRRRSRRRRILKIE